MRAELGVPDGAALLVTVARLAPQKGLDILVDALRGLVTAGRLVVAVVAGDGPLEGDCGGPRPGGCPCGCWAARRRARPARRRRRGRVPSRWEGQSLNLQEALRAGAALVATDAGGNREVTGDAALLVPAGDPAALAAGDRGAARRPGPDRGPARRGAGAGGPPALGVRRPATR